MTAQLKKTEQTRLHSCVLAMTNWAKINEKPRQHARETFKIGGCAVDTANGGEITRENSQGHHSMSLLGKYPLNQPENN